MSRRICRSLTLALLMVVLPLAILRAQETEAKKPAEKSTTEAEKSAAEKAKTEKSTAEKNAPEKGTSEKSMTEGGSSASYPQQSMIAPAVELRPVNKLITLQLTEDSRIVYETIGKQAGIGVLFDPDYTSRRISVDLNGVSLPDALKIVAFESRTFWRPLTSSTIFVAADSPVKRRELGQEIIRSFYLPNFGEATELQDLVNTLRTILQIERIQQLSSHNLMIVRGTPDQLAITQKIINDMNEAKRNNGEYRLEFKVSELEGEKKLNSKTYTLLTRPRVKTMLRTGNRVPIEIGYAVDKTNPDKKVTDFQYLDVGQNIDCVVEWATEHTLALSVVFERADLVLHDKTDSDVVPSAPGQPVFHQVKTEGKTIVELGQPTVVLSADDPRSDHTFQVEVTVTRVRQKD
jgi:hypothetical protein